MGKLFDRLKGFLARHLRPEDSLLEVVGGVIVVLAIRIRRVRDCGVTGNVAQSS